MIGTNSMEKGKCRLYLHSNSVQKMLDRQRKNAAWKQKNSQMDRCYRLPS